MKMREIITVMNTTKQQQSTSGDSVVHEVKFTRCLGIESDNELNWKIHFVERIYSCPRKLKVFEVILFLPAISQNHCLFCDRYVNLIEYL